MIHICVIFVDRFAGEYYTEDGTKVDKDLLGSVINIFRETVDAMVNLSFSKSKSTLTCNEYLSNQMSTVLASFPDDQREGAGNIFRSLLNILKEDCGDDLKQLSLACNGFEDDFQNDDYTLPVGYENLLKKLMTNFEPNAINFGTEVKVIDWSETDRSSHSVTLTCIQRGQEVSYSANHVISTIPLGVLKKNHHTLFNPSLSKEKASMIDKLGFGKVNKVLLYYSEPFWIKGEGGVKLVWDERNRQGGNDEMAWTRDIFAFKEMKHIDNVLIAWIYGDSAETMESLDDATVADGCTQVLRHFLSDSRIPRPDDIRTSKWCTDPYTLGAYTFITSGFHYDDLITLSLPLLHSSGKPTVLFAGEATHEENYASVHGAMLSGIREAKRVMKWSKTCNRTVCATL